MNEQSLQKTIALKELIAQARETSRTVTTPSDRSRLNCILRQSHQQILDLNGRYIKRPLKDETITSKFILLDQNSYDKVIQQSHEIREIQTPKINSTYSEMIPVGRQRLFPLYWPDAWSQLPEENQELLINRHQGIESAQKYSADAICLMIASHEISHLYMDDSLPLWLAETGAYYYSRKSVEAMGISANSPSWEPYEKVYTSLEEKYGENLHHTYFGTLETQLFRLLICLQYSSDESIRKLFPH
ncbi:MAG: hypothetical protein WCV81_02690 [Microgenomates group bacterium]|jgi:hypothetical protein